MFVSRGLLKIPALDKFRISRQIKDRERGFQANESFLIMSRHPTDSRIKQVLFVAGRTECWQTSVKIGWMHVKNYQLFAAYTCRDEFLIWLKEIRPILGFASRNGIIFMCFDCIAFCERRGEKKKKKNVCPF